MFIAAGIILVVASAAVLVAGSLLLTRYADTVHQEPMLGRAAAAGPAKIDGPLNVLLIGVDERPDSAEPVRSDSIIIAHVNAAHDRVYLISVPRDLAVEIPPYPKTGYQGGRDKINAAFAYGSANGLGRRGGVELLGLAIRHNLAGITFDAGAVVDFGGFRSVVRALGGVDMCIDERVVSHHIGTGPDGGFLAPDLGGRPAVYQPGCRHLAPWQALDFVRQRYGLTNGDYDRQRHQQQLLKAVAAEAKRQGVMRNPVRLYRIMRASRGALTVDTRGVSLQNWIFTVSGVLGSGDAVMVRTNAGRVNPTFVSGESAERLSPDSIALFTSLRDDRLDAFISAHPDFVSTGGPAR
ncbi:MAG: hypothetical protein QOI74_518 [Micromonosporaceae bacterium]|jgi:LCP family protein required for cell wall assembly|nr:hypothetical protein [Micromonosporaceae bacterium]